MINIYKRVLLLVKLFLLVPLIIWTRWCRCRDGWIFNYFHIMFLNNLIMRLHTNLCCIIPLISACVPTSFSRLHLLRPIQTLPAAYWFHLSHCINPPGTTQEVVLGHLDAAQSLFSSLFLLLSWPLVFPRLFGSRKLRLSEYEGTRPSVGKYTPSTLIQSRRLDITFGATV